MFRWWVKLLPFCVVEWAALKWCERQPCGDMRVVQPFGKHNPFVSFVNGVPREDVRITLIQVFRDE